MNVFIIPILVSALAILNASDLKLISNSIQLLYDHHGKTNFYLRSQI